MRCLMSLGERTRPDAPTYAEDPAPDQARALALVDDFAHLFTVLREWRREYGDELTAWAVQVEADNVENLPAELIEQWEWEGAPVRLDTETGRLREGVRLPRDARAPRHQRPHHHRPPSVDRRTLTRPAGPLASLTTPWKEKPCPSDATSAWSSAACPA
ncbi:hypothetical protein PV415_29715 [Streptomyces sp. ME03-5684b]|uniref:hypothetical protein n=1 Tax=Streptomyces sp. ME03-5684b TaxID=3028681 RepID=UPI0029AF28D1|nr:hypothetical protein [Streptomyces sp. ME03-5684b]MDX3321091.1 hypothetical protein [Streptomyces sp. ME03-5684b]